MFLFNTKNAYLLRFQDKVLNNKKVLRVTKKRRTFAAENRNRVEIEAMTLRAGD